MLLQKIPRPSDPVGQHSTAKTASRGPLLPLPPSPHSAHLFDGPLLTAGAKLQESQANAVFLHPSLCRPGRHLKSGSRRRGPHTVQAQQLPGTPSLSLVSPTNVSPGSHSPSSTPTCRVPPADSLCRGHSLLLECSSLSPLLPHAPLTST